MYKRQIVFFPVIEAIAPSTLDADLLNPVFNFLNQFNAIKFDSFYLFQFRIVPSNPSGLISKIFVETIVQASTYSFNFIFEKFVE